MKLARYSKNPILKPTSNWWESKGVFNPGATLYKDQVYLVYRAWGEDNFSRFISHHFCLGVIEPITIISGLLLFISTGILKVVKLLCSVGLPTHLVSILSHIKTANSVINPLPPLPNLRFLSIA